MNDELQRKLGLPAGAAAYILHPPVGYAVRLPRATLLSSTSALATNLEWLQAFYTDAAGLEKEIAGLAGKLSQDGQLWLCWPKRSSGITSDLSDGIVRRLGLEAGLVDTKVAAIDDTWSGLKFVYRRRDRLS
jgi:hypothetical protein